MVKIMNISGFSEHARRAGEEFEVVVNAAMSMDEFIKLLWNHPANATEKRNGSRLLYKPHDARDLGTSAARLLKPFRRKGKPNCQLRLDAATVYESGLCYGAIIEQIDPDSCYD